MKQAGDTVRFRDDGNVNYTALVVAVHGDQSLDLAYCPQAGQLERIDKVPHRSAIEKLPAKHWVG